MEVDDPHITIMKVVNLVFWAYQTLAWLTPSIFMHMVAKILSQEFDNITKQLKEIRDSGVIKTQEILESTRRHHQRLCKLVGHADDIFSMQIAVTFCGSFAMVCLGMYICIYSTPAGTNRTLVLIMWSFWLVMGLARILLDCVSGSVLNAAVSKIRVMPCVWLILASDDIRLHQNDFECHILLELLPLLLGDHWRRVTQKFGVCNVTIIGSDNGLSPGRRKAIIWTSARNRK